MIHYSCDRCKRRLDPANDLRYVVKIEIQAAMDTLGEHEHADDRDHLSEIDDILESATTDEDDEIGEDIYQKRRFDLCPQCYRKFVGNPLGREVKPALGFSKN